MSYPLSSTLDEITELSIRLDLRIRARRKERREIRGQSAATHHLSSQATSALPSPATPISADLELIGSGEAAIVSASPEMDWLVVCRKWPHGCLLHNGNKTQLWVLCSESCHLRP